VIPDQVSLAAPTGHEVLLTITNPDREGAEVTLDAFYALPDHAGSDYAGLLERLGVEC
jgi:hypothetical protein